jgi:hypothetical protein
MHATHALVIGVEQVAEIRVKYLIAGVPGLASAMLWMAMSSGVSVRHKSSVSARVAA